MRILHISTRLILGGSQENTVLSCEGQASRDHDVHLAFGPIYGPEGSLLARVRRFNKRCADGEQKTDRGEPCRPITTHVVEQMFRDIKPIADLRCLRQLERLIASISPDVVHTHSSKAGILGRAAAWKLSRRRRPGRSPLAVVHTVHGSPFHPYQSRLKNAVYIASERYAARRCHRIISVCDAMTTQYLRAGIGRPERYVTVYSGMEVDRYLTPPPGQTREAVRAELGLSPDDFVIGTVARLAELKGHDDLLDALADELSRRPNFKLLWVGDGWWRDRLLKRVSDMDLARRVVTTGLVPSERVPGMIRAMDVLVHPSYREGLPRTVPQALLCGVPPIAYDLDGAPEVVRNRQTGLLVKPKDTSGLREAIVWMSEHPDERRTMAERGRDECRVRFSAERMVDELQHVYESVLGEQGE